MDDCYNLIIIIVAITIVTIILFIRVVFVDDADLISVVADVNSTGGKELILRFSRFFT